MPSTSTVSDSLVSIGVEVKYPTGTGETVHADATVVSADEGPIGSARLYTDSPLTVEVIPGAVSPEIEILLSGDEATLRAVSMALAEAFRRVDVIRSMTALG